ncbi:MAG TPA: helix-turn-helix domain-containing protein [Solirubrobacterales bacterium]|nr:helix-turn-helix domain-containing protein [Solirubrobacterales bacterium]
MDQTRDQAGEFKPAVLLGHPERINILAVCGQREITPSEYAAQEGLSLEQVNYHFRSLLNAAFLDVTRKEDVGGAKRVFYRARRQGLVTDEEFVEMDFKKRRRFTLSTLRALYRRAIAAARTGTFDRRTSSHLTWDAGHLDRRAFDQGMEALMATHEFFQQLKKESAVRLAESGEEPIYTTCGLMGFESPGERQPPGGLGGRFRALEG